MKRKSGQEYPSLAFRGNFVFLYWHDMHTDPRPRSITLDRPRGLLVIDWQDGAHCEYPLAGVRAICPCVSCRGGHEFMGLPVDPDDLFKSPAPGVSTEVTTASFVGDYALQITWADGHSSGIYGWALLRPLCPQAPGSGFA